MKTVEKINNSLTALALKGNFDQVKYYAKCAGRPHPYLWFEKGDKTAWKEYKNDTEALTAINRVLGIK